jgi:hypothetical protein
MIRIQDLLTYQSKLHFVLEFANVNIDIDIDTNKDCDF